MKILSTSLLRLFFNCGPQQAFNIIITNQNKIVQILKCIQVYTKIGMEILNKSKNNDAYPMEKNSYERHCFSLISIMRLSFSLRNAHASPAHGTRGVRATRDCPSKKNSVRSVHTQ